MYDLNKIKSELDLLPKWDDQICLQGANGETDPFCGTGRVLDLKYKDAFLTKYLVYEKDKKLVLNEKGKIVLKNAIVFLVFNLISYPIWRYVIFK